MFSQPFTEHGVKPPLFTKIFDKMVQRGEKNSLIKFAELFDDRDPCGIFQRLKAAISHFPIPIGKTVEELVEIDLLEEIYMMILQNIKDKYLTEIEEIALTETNLENYEKKAQYPAQSLYQSYVNLTNYYVRLNSC